MATIAEQLTSLANTKTAIKDAIVAKGVAVADTDPFSAYAGKIGQISGGGGESAEEWQPNPNWWDIKKILDEDTRDYAGKVGVILYNFNDVSDFQLSNPLSSGMTAVATSDGAFYSYADNGSKVTHNWDTTQDKDDGRGFKTRWVIYYYTKDTTSEVFRQDSNTYGWKNNFIAYLILRINCSYPSGFCSEQKLLEFIESSGYTIYGTTYSAFCYQCFALRALPENIDTSKSTSFYSFAQNCYSLNYLPEGLDTSNGTSFSYFCMDCKSLRKLPDNLDTSKGTNFSYFLQGCSSLQTLPDNLDTSNGTDFSYFCASCSSLRKLPDNLDTSKGTNFRYFLQYGSSLNSLPEGLDTSNGTIFTYFCAGCTIMQAVRNVVMSANTTAITSKYSGPLNSNTWLKTVNLTLPSNTNFWLDMSTVISIESFRYIADHAPDVTATPRTLTVGSTNISRINAEDPTIITDLNAKGWTVA